MIAANLFTDTVVNGFTPGDQITNNTTLGGQGSWTIDSVTGDISFEPDDPCVPSFGLFTIESTCCASNFTITYNGQCLVCDDDFYGVIDRFDWDPDNQIGPSHTPGAEPVNSGNAVVSNSTAMFDGNPATTTSWLSLGTDDGYISPRGHQWEVSEPVDPGDITNFVFDGVWKDGAGSAGIVQIELIDASGVVVDTIDVSAQFNAAPSSSGAGTQIDVPLSASAPWKSFRILQGTNNEFNPSWIQIPELSFVGPACTGVPNPCDGFEFVSPQDFTPDPSDYTKGDPIAVDNFLDALMGSSWNPATVSMSLLSNDGDGTIALNSPSNGEFTYTPAATDGLVQIVMEYADPGGCTAQITTYIDCRCQNWECPNSLAPYDCELGRPIISIDFTDNFLNGLTTPTQQRIYRVLDWLGESREMQFGDDCQFVAEHTNSEGNRVEVEWNFSAPGPAATVTIYDDSGNMTETIVFLGDCGTPFIDVDFTSYTIRSVATMSTTGGGSAPENFNDDENEAARLVFNEGVSNQSELCEPP